MKRKIEKVNSEAGTLKQTTNLMRNGMRIPAKLAAFFLMFSLALTNMSFVQYSDSVIKSDNKTTSTEVNDTCCDVSKAKVTGSAKKILKLYNLPSAEMIRKSDNEANNNLAYSLTENKVKALKALIAKSDAEISERFKAETSVQTSELINASVADDIIVNRFNAENLSIDMNSLTAKGDAVINKVFEKETNGIKSMYANVISADADINKLFIAELARISIPAADSFQIADAAIQNMYQQDVQQGLVINND